MIPDLPPSVSDKDTMEFYNSLWANLSDQSSVHVNWHTHRQNPAVCWICDLFNLTSKMLYLYDKNISKSSLDMETELSSVNDSDSEIETDNADVVEPEYDVDYDNCDDETVKDSIYHQGDDER